MHKRHMGMLEHVINKYNLKKVADLSKDSMEKVLDLRRKRQDSEASEHGASRFESFVYYPMLNPLGAGHGASSAALLAAAVRAHLCPDGSEDKIRVEITEMSVSYLDPVPDRQAADVIVTPLSDSSTTYLAEIRSKQGHLYVRGRVTAIAHQDS